MIPIVMRASEEALNWCEVAARRQHGAGRESLADHRRIIVPAALPAIVTAVFLAVARVAGETAPLLLTTGENRDFALSPNEPTSSVPTLIYKYAWSPYEDWHRKAWAAALS